MLQDPVSMSVVDHDHLVEKEIVPVRVHFSYDCVILAEPRVDLLRSRGVEPPLAVWRLQLRPDGRIAVSSTDDVGFVVLTLEVKHVDREGAVGKMVAHLLTTVLEETPYTTVLVMPVHSWH